MTETFDPTTLPHYSQGNEALLGLLRATKQTPAIGQSMYQFTIRGTSVHEAKKFVQRIRSALSKRRTEIKKHGVEIQHFSLAITSITPLPDHNLTIIAIGRSQKIVRPKETFNAEMIELLAHPAARNAKQMQSLVTALRSNAALAIKSSDWDMLCTAMVAVLSHEAVYSHYDAEEETHIITRF